VDGLNGETAFKAEDVLIGQVDGKPYGYKRALDVTVSVRMEWLTRQDTYETTAHVDGLNGNGLPCTVHKRVSRPLDFAITTAVWQPPRYDRDMISGGATVEPLGELISYAPGWDAGKAARLIELSAWHLNGMTAGCDHQVPVMETDRYGRTVPSLDLTPPCPETGYRYGHAWLVRELPPGMLDEVRALFAG